MAKVIWDFNEFMQSRFNSLSMGLTPSGHLHLGFLSTLACALMYLKEHPQCHLIITNVENSLSSRLEKYNALPLQFQTIEEGELAIPADFNQWKRRNSAASKVHNELMDLIWQLIKIFDDRTRNEKKKIKQAFIPPKHKRFLNLKENTIFHFFGTQVYIYSFLKILQKDRIFKNNMMKFLCDPKFAQIVGPMCGIDGKVKWFGGHVIRNGKKFKPYAFQVPIRLYDQKTKELSKEWSRVVFGHPDFNGPVLAAQPRSIPKLKGGGDQGYDKYIYHSLKEGMGMGEFHFLLDPMRDFFNPFKSECHIFGGDYFQLEYYQSGMKAIDKVQKMFEYMESKTGQEKAFFAGPLITMEGKKMAKSGMSFNIKDLKKIKPVFLNIVRLLELSRSKTYKKGLQLEYTELLKRTA